MENNLDDILVDNPESQEKQEKKDQSKRKLLIGVASALLIAVVILTLYFVFAKKEEPKGLEVTHAELEKFINPNQDQNLQNKRDEEFNKLIAEVKKKHPKTNEEVVLKQEQVVQNNQQGVDIQVQETEELSEKQINNFIETKIQELSSDATADTKIQEQPQEVKEAPHNIEKSQTQKPQSEIKKNSNQDKKTTQKKRENKTKQNNQSKSAAQTFDSLEKKIPQGFYLQVGVFGEKPNADFFSNLSSFPYQKERLDRGGKVVNRYLIGPFDTKEKAQEKIDEVTKKVAKPLIVEIK